jgi:hypothetical protein
VDTAVNYLDLIACLSILLHLLALLLYNNLDFWIALKDVGLDSPKALDGILVAASIAFFLYGVTVCCFRIGEAYYRADTATRAAKVVATAVVSLQTDLILIADAFLNALSVATKPQAIFAEGDRVEHLSLGVGLVESVMEHGRGHAVVVAFGNGAKEYYETESELARLSLVVSPDAKASYSCDTSSLVFLKDFTQACSQVCQDSGLKMRDASVLEATFAVLKLAHEDDDRYNATRLSARMRSTLATDRGLPITVVSCRTRGLPAIACSETQNAHNA